MGIVVLIFGALLIGIVTAIKIPNSIVGIGVAVALGYLWGVFCGWIGLI